MINALKTPTTTTVTPNHTPTSSQDLRSLCKAVSNLSLNNGSLIVTCTECKPDFHFAVHNLSDFEASQEMGKTVTKIKCTCPLHQHTLIFPGTVEENIQQHRFVQIKEFPDFENQ